MQRVRGQFTVVNVTFYIPFISCMACLSHGTAYIQTPSCVVARARNVARRVASLHVDV